MAKLTNLQGMCKLCIKTRMNRWLVPLVQMFHVAERELRQHELTLTWVCGRQREEDGKEKLAKKKKNNRMKERRGRVEGGRMEEKKGEST